MVAASFATLRAWSGVCYKAQVRLSLIGLVPSMFLLGGCLSNNYQLSHAELVRLSRMPPRQRGAQVRVLQQTQGNETPVETEANWPAPEPSLQFGGQVDITHGGSGAEATLGQPDSAHPGADVPHVPATPGGSVRVSSGQGVALHSWHNDSGRGISGSGSHGSGTSYGGSGGAGDAIVLAIVGVAAVGVIAVSAAALEGRRFDGWALVDPDEQLVLVRRRSRLSVPLSALSERDAAAAEYGIIPGHVRRIERAPLDRRGFAYELELGGARLNTVTGVDSFGFAGRFGFGYFPTQTLGILGGGQVAFGDSSGGPGHGLVFNGRVFGELEFLPLHLGRFHAGLYTDLGDALSLHDLADRTHHWWGLYAAAGVLSQVEWTTRLAFDLRAGVAALPAHPGSDALQRAYVPELSAGLAVY